MFVAAVQSIGGAARLLVVGCCVVGNREAGAG